MILLFCLLFFLPLVEKDTKAMAFFVLLVKKILVNCLGFYGLFEIDWLDSLYYYQEPSICAPCNFSHVNAHYESIIFGIIVRVKPVR